MGIPKAIDTVLDVLRDKDRRLARVEVKTGVVEYEEMGKDLVHGTIAIRMNAIKKEVKRRFSITGNEGGIRKGSQSGGAFRAVKIKSKVEMFIADKVQCAKERGKRRLIDFEDVI